MAHATPCGNFGPGPVTANTDAVLRVHLANGNTRGQVADFYEDEVGAMVKALTSMLEPAMIVVVGGIVGSILLAMYLPMFTVFDQIQ